jgi:hypothetical protein
MVKDKRKAVRRPIRYTAWISLDGKELHGCVLSDVSESGARIDIDDSKKIPDDFTLLLASNGSARRKCHVVRRDGRQIGVSFERQPIVNEKATLVPTLEPGGDIAKTETAQTETVILDAEPAKS